MGNQPPVKHSSPFILCCFTSWFHGFLFSFLCSAKPVPKRGRQLPKKVGEKKIYDSNDKAFVFYNSLAPPLIIEGILGNRGRQRVPDRQRTQGTSPCARRREATRLVLGKDANCLHNKKAERCFSCCDRTSSPACVPTTCVPTTSVSTTCVPTTSVSTTCVPTTCVSTTCVPTTCGLELLQELKTHPREKSRLPSVQTCRLSFLCHDALTF